MVAETAGSQRHGGDRPGRLAENLVHFARVLRECGLPVGPAKVLQAIEAVEAVGITSRDDFYWALHSVFVNRRTQRDLFDQAFHVFWRNPKFLERMMSLLLPEFRYPDDAAVPPPMQRRIDEAMTAGHKPKRPPPRRQDQPEELEVDARFTYSDRELLQDKDFEQMTAAEIARAKQAIASMRLELKPLPVRRRRPASRGNRIDMRATMRRSLRGGGGDLAPVYGKRRERPPSLVLLCDISGSMSQYSRMLLHFAHALTGDRERVHSFVFGTRLTNITRYLREKDVDVALDRVSSKVSDWSGGTRLGQCLHEFNRHWSRRVLGQGAVVVLITDGLDRDAGVDLAQEADRLHKSCRRLVWLNPLLRYEGFEAKALGMQALMPHVDDFRAAHNLDSLTDLTTLLSRDAQTLAVRAAA